MNKSGKQLNRLLAAIIFSSPLPLWAADWVISAPVIVNSGHLNDKVIIDSSIKATESGQSVVKVDGFLGGIRVNSGKTIETEEGFWDEGSGELQADHAAINITSVGRVTETIETHGYIKSGINISGSVQVDSGSALLLQGNDDDDKAVLKHSVSVRENGNVKSENDHAITIGGHGFADLINIEKNGSIATEGSNKSAIYIGQNGQLGGGLNQSVDGGDILFYNGKDSTPIINVQGRVSSDTGSGIKIDTGGSATGAIFVHGDGHLEGATTTGEAAVYIDGTYHGGIHNYSGDITGGIVVGANGSHVAATTVTSSLGGNPDALESGDRSAYFSVGGSSDKAELKGGYTVLSGGSAISTYNHTLHLGSHSSADFIRVDGMLESSASGKAAIHVDAGAALGSDSDADAVTVNTGGIIESENGDAIVVDGAFTGWIGIRGGTLKAKNAAAYAVNFTNADNALKFYQDGAGYTKGSIKGSGQATDVLNILGGNVDSQTLSDLETITLANTQLNSSTIVGVNDFTARNSTVNTGTLAGLSALTVNTNTRLNIQEGFTLPETTTVEVESGYNKSQAVIDVDEILYASIGGSDLHLKPTSAAAYNELLANGSITVIDYSDGSLDNNLEERVTASADGAFKPRDSLLFEVAPDYSTDGKIAVTVTPNPIESRIEGLGLSEAEKTLIREAIKASVSPSANDQDKQNGLLDLVTHPDTDIRELASDLVRQHDTTTMTTNSMVHVHKVLGNRLRIAGTSGLGFGDDDGFYGYESYEEDDYKGSYGPGFAFLGGAAWVQYIYNTSKHEKVEHDFGFDSTMSGFVFGLDTDLTDNFRMGGAGSWTRSSVKGEHDSSATINNFMASFYGHWNKAGWFADTMISIGRGKSDTGKVVLNQQVNAHYESQFRGLKLVIGHEFTNGAWDFAPQAELHIGSISFDTFREKGSSGGEQEIKIRDYRTLELGGGFRVNLGEGLGYGIRPALSVMGFYDFEDVGSEIEATYLAAGESFTVQGPSRDRFRLQTGVGVNIDVLESWTLNTSYYLNLSKHFQSHNFSAKARYSF